jgi:hypothetical protein
MGNSASTNKINFEDLQSIIHKPDSYLIINTMSETEQACLIKGTVNSKNEVKIINELLKKATTDINILIYGKNVNDESVYKKNSYLYNLGFYNVYIYTGGLFEWLCLQDIYGEENFQTTSKEADILKFRAPKKLNTLLLTNS